jgi:Response regulator of the LytR/AlgR family
VTFKYKVQALDYIIKSSKEEMQKNIRGAIQEDILDYKNTDKDEKNIIPIESGSRIINFNLEDIIFFETTGKDHNLRVHIFEDEIEFYGSMKEIEQKVTSDYYRTHQSYLINKKKIKEIEEKNMIEL